MPTNIHEAHSEGKKSGALKKAALVLLAVVLAGCPAGRQPTGPVEGKVSIKGSNTFGDELAQRLIAEYRKEQPKVTFDLESKGSASGFAALLAGECDIAAASGGVSDDVLLAAKSRGIELNHYGIGHYGVAVIVNTNNPVPKLSQNQVREIFTGVITNWRTVGGPDAPIQVYIRDSDSGTHLGFRKLAMKNKPYVPSARAFTNYAQLADGIVRDGNGIGYSSMGLAGRSGVKAVTIGWMPPSVVSVNQDKYPYARAVRLYTNKAKETPAAKDFIRFVQSKRGQEIVAEMGFVRIFEPRLDFDSID